jgi:hypothetical protein
MNWDGRKKAQKTQESWPRRFEPFELEEPTLARVFAISVPLCGLLQSVGQTAIEVPGDRSKYKGWLGSSLGAPSEYMKCWGLDARAYSHLDPSHPAFLRHHGGPNHDGQSHLADRAIVV